MYRKKLEKDLLLTMQILEKVVKICTFEIQGFVKWELDKSLKKMWKFAHVKLRKFSHLKSGKKFTHEKIVKICTWKSCENFTYDHDDQKYMYIIKLKKIIDDQGQQVYILSDLLDKVFC